MSRLCCTSCYNDNSQLKTVIYLWAVLHLRLRKVVVSEKQQFTVVNDRKGKLHPLLPNPVQRLPSSLGRNANIEVKRCTEDSLIVTPDSVLSFLLDITLLTFLFSHFCFMYVKFAAELSHWSTYESNFLPTLLKIYSRVFAHT